MVLNMASGANQILGNFMSESYISEDSVKIESMNDLDISCADNLTLGDLHFELRRRNLEWAILNDTVAEYQRKKIAAMVIEADSKFHSGLDN